MPKSIQVTPILASLWFFLALSPVLVLCSCNGPSGMTRTTTTDSDGVGVCGDGNVDVPAEECDDSNTFTEACAYDERQCVVCNAACRWQDGSTSYCGDGHVDAQNGEECDDDTSRCAACRHVEGDELAFTTGKYLFVTKAVDGASDHDLDFLAATAAASALAEGKPAVLAVTDAGALSGQAWHADYIDRYKPAKAITLNINSGTVAHTSDVINIDDEPPGAATARALAETVWVRASRAVVCAGDDFESALMAAALAARVRSPLLFPDPIEPDALDNTLQSLGVESVLTVGPVQSPPVSTIQLLNANEVVAWMEDNGLPVTYMAAVNATDRAPHADASKMSLVAPLLAGLRDGAVIPLANATSHDTVRAELRQRYAALRAGEHPEYLAIVAGVAHIPFGQVPAPMFADEDPIQPTDAIYADVDDDPFLEVAVGRLVANDFSEASLLVSRIATYDHLKDGHWENRYIEAGRWGIVEIAPLLDNAGFVGEDLTGRDLSNRSPIEAGVTLHQDHSWWLGLGHAFDMSTQTVLAPTVILSRGCSTAALHKSTSNIVKRLFRQGALAHMGGPRNLITMSGNMAVATFNAILEGESLGHAYQRAFAAATLNSLDNDHRSASDYGRYNWVLIGDPALVIHAPAGPTATPAHVSVSSDGLSLKARAPEIWWELPVPDSLLHDEWGYDGSNHIPVGAGTAPLMTWSGAGYDVEYHYFVAEYHTGGTVTGIAEEAGVSEPLGWGGSFARNVHVDEHHDGTRTYLWRVRFIDYDQEAASFRAQRDSITYTVTLTAP